MFASQPEKWATPYIIAVVEFDMQKMRLRIVLAREAIRERLRELEDLTTITGKGRVSSASDDCELDKMRQQRKAS